MSEEQNAWADAAVEQHQRLLEAEAQNSEWATPEEIEEIRHSVEKSMVYRQQLKEQGINVLHHTKWLELRSKDGYVYMHSPWCNAHAVAVLPFRQVPSAHGLETEYLTVTEARPCHDNVPAPYSITGGCDKEGELWMETAAREVYEETGYKVAPEDLIILGEIRDCKASDMTLHLYAVRIEVDAVAVKPEGDGSGIEASATANWVNELTAVWNSPDPIISQMILRLRYKTLHMTRQK